MKKKTKFSIVMPVYNSKDTLVKAIESIVNQSYRDYELIIVDDHSADESYKMAKKLASKNRKIRLYRMTRNRGAPYCMNFGTKKAKYKWIGNADSDIIVPKNWLERANKCIQKNSDLFGGKYVYLPDTYKKNYLGEVFHYLESFLFPNEDKSYNKNNFSEPLLAGGSFFYKKRLFEKIDGFDINIRAGYDRLFSSLAVKEGFNVMYTPKLFVYHPLYNYKNIKTFLKRHIFFTKWKNLIFKKSKLMEKPYKKVPYLFFTSLIFMILLILLLGLLNTLKILIGLIFFIFLAYSLKLSIKDKLPLKYISGYIFLDFTKKSIASVIYLLKIKPKQLDWKDR